MVNLLKKVGQFIEESAEFVDEEEITEMIDEDKFTEQFKSGHYVRSAFLPLAVSGRESKIAHLLFWSASDPFYSADIKPGQYKANVLTKQVGKEGWKKQVTVNFELLPQYVESIKAGNIHTVVPHQHHETRSLLK